MTKLKPCPFCGGEAIVVKTESCGRYIGCWDCGGRTEEFETDYAGSAHDKAISAWNRRADVVPVVRCVECIWWQDRQVQLIDGSCRDYMPDEPWSVTCDVGINVGSHCTKHGFDDKSGSWFWAAANDYCSRGEREGTMTND